MSTACVIPAGKTLTATVAGSTNLGVILWSSAARTVFATGTNAAKWELDGSNRPGNRAEQVVYRNTGRKAVSAYLDIWFAKGATRRATYTATVTLASGRSQIATDSPSCRPATSRFGLRTVTRTQLTSKRPTIASAVAAARASIR